MGWRVRLELTTTGVQVRRSTVELPPPPKPLTPYRVSGIGKKWLLLWIGDGNVFALRRPWMVLGKPLRDEQSCYRRTVDDFGRYGFCHVGNSYLVKDEWFPVSLGAGTLRLIGNRPWPRLDAGISFTKLCS